MALFFVPDILSKSLSIPFSVCNPQKFSHQQRFFASAHLQTMASVHVFPLWVCFSVTGSHFYFSNHCHVRLKSFKDNKNNNQHYQSYQRKIECSLPYVSSENMTSNNGTSGASEGGK